jgi:UDPglucose--hexose-1-phosphate uridylyltransferase
MPELRKDYLLNKFVIIAKERSKRPNDFFKEKNEDHFSNDINEEKKNKDIFAKGNEHLTTSEIGRREDHNGWYIRYFENKYPATTNEGNYELATHNEFFTFSKAYGKHEVIVESPNKDDELADLSVEHLTELLKVYRERINELEKIKGIAYVNVFKNHLKEAGTSIKHTHSQILGLNIIPNDVKEKCEIMKKKGKHVYEKIIEIERFSHRKAFENDDAVAFTPYASRFPLEIWVMPKKYKRDLNELNDKELNSISEILKKTFTKLKKINSPYNFHIHYAPKEHDLHLQFIICPRLNIWGGFETSTDIVINPITPEDAAHFYREK